MQAFLIALSLYLLPVIFSFIKPRLEVEIESAVCLEMGLMPVQLVALVPAHSPSNKLDQDLY